MSGTRALPAPDELTAPYWDAAARHELRVMRCDSCDAYRHPPTATCHGCGSPLATWELLSGNGTVWSFIVDHRNLVPGFSEPYAVALVVPVETGDEVRIVTNLVGCPLEEIYVGMPVEVTWEDTLPQFRRAT